MNKNEKTDVYHNIGFNTELNEKTNLKNQTTKQTKNNSKRSFKLYMENHNTEIEKNQIIFDFGKPPKLVFQTITCYDCKQSRELDGYRFALVAICDCCRTKEELRVLNNRIDRRAK